MTDMSPYLAIKDEEKSCEQSDSDDNSDVDDWDLPLVFDKPRHLEIIKGAERVEHSWRVKEKYKTHCVALVLCLNVGVDPPDVVKTQPCARLECWIDPNSLSPSKALENIGLALQVQYERWQPRARYKQSLDPTSDEVKKLCCSLRRNAKEERVLFHYNGHGVPKPTAQGEIWVFNRAYTQYIPLSMYDLQTWMGAPSLYVYDCSNAGVILEHFRLFADQHEREYEASMASKSGGGEGPNEAGPGTGPVSYRNCIQLAACAAGQSLPMNPELPADLFTACLTTPVKMAMKWFVLRTPTRVAPNHVYDLIDKIPGQVTDRRTMLGELNWIFTAITDTIAWSSLPPDLFQQLFRADLLTASLCRNFLLADRIMRSYNCTPVSAPALPSLARHPLWAAWEHTLDLALAQLPALLRDPAPDNYSHSPFFRDQLTAFQVWLELGSPLRLPPAQLPMVLQVLLSTLHRLRALQLLCRFVSLGGWAARAVLHVGIFPYMLKLLQASAPDLRPTMVYIWARLVAVDPSCQVDLVNAKGHKYFLSILQDPTVDSEHRTLAAYVLAAIVDNFPAGQEAALQGSMISVCLEQLGETGDGEGGEGGDGCAALRQWACLALGRLWRAYDAARWAAVRDLAHEKLYPLLAHPQPQVRAACVFALGTLVSWWGARSEHAAALQQQVAGTLAARAHTDASCLVRQELLAALQWLVLTFEQHFIAVYMQERGSKNDKGRPEPDRGVDALTATRARSPSAQPILPSIGFGSVYMKVWRVVTAMAREPHPLVSQMAADIIAYIANQVDSGGREVRVGGSSSLPPSPNTRPSPLAHHTRTLPHPGSRRGKTGLPHTISEDSVAARDSSRERNSSTSSTTSQCAKKAIVSTQYVQWASATFGARASPADCEAPPHHERAWRYSRNRTLRKHARGLVGARVSRVDSQAFHSRCPLPPAVVLFHPYDQHLAIASKDNFGVWDWGSGARVCVGTWRKAWGRVSALAYLNAHDHALLAVASHSGNLAIYRPSSSTTEPALVGAWRALDVRPAPDYRPPPAQPLISLEQLVSQQFSGDERLARLREPMGVSGGVGVPGGGGAAGGVGGAGGAFGSTPPATLVRWSAARRTLLLAGAAPVLRLWDASAELLHADIPTESESAVTCVWRGEGEGERRVAAGFAEGAVRVWDERGGRPALALRLHRAPLRALALRPAAHRLLSVCAEGTVRVCDMRGGRGGGEGGLVGGAELAGGAGEVVRAAGPLAAAAVHPRADLLACGSAQQSVSLYEVGGAHLNTIKFHEGFMGARIGPVACLAFHPLRVALAVGSKDSSVCVYVSEPRR